MKINKLFFAIIFFNAIQITGMERVEDPCFILKDTPEGVDYMLFSPNGKYFAAGSSAGQFKIWDLSDKSDESHSNPIYGFRISDAHTRNRFISMFFSDNNKYLIIWAVEYGKYKVYQLDLINKIFNNADSEVKLEDKYINKFSKNIVSMDGQYLASLYIGNKIIEIWHIKSLLNLDKRD